MNKTVMIALAASAVIIVGLGVKYFAAPEVNGAIVIQAEEAAIASPDTTDIKNGEDVYDHWCAACHDPGPGHPGTQSLAIKYGGERPAALEERTDLSPEITAYFVRNGYALMPFFRKTEISDADLRDLSAYLARGE
ncbi:c-type cytochrome [Marinicaulis aureus]|uniref:C-type cytochrome n=1 Tax=Hyphococcus aureus TaxID=2666033 RepID=A0ABW1KYA7_9PROT